MLVHHVFFYMHPDAREADKAALRAGLETLTVLPQIRQWHIGVPADTDRPVIVRDYAISWLTIFDSLADEEIYQDDPIHHVFVENCKHLWTKVVVYDSI